MPFQFLLDRMRSLRGVEAVIFLDSEGEIIVHSGGNDFERLRIVGAYQGIVIACANRLGLNDAKSLCIRYQERSVLTRALKDGYFISVIFNPELNFAYATFVFQEIYQKLEEEL